MIPGERSVQIGHDAVGNVILTGDHNVVVVVQIARVLEPEVTHSPIGPNPYKSLSAFQEEDADLFFGREELTLELWDEIRKLHEPGQDGETRVRLFAVLGPSGSGKSSLVRAGLIPALAHQPLRGLKQLRVVPVIPGAHPVGALAQALARLITGDLTPVAKAEEFEKQLAKRDEHGKPEPYGLRRIAGDTPLLVIVDQFEQVYTLAAEQERESFLAHLLHAAEDRGGMVTVLLTLRSDLLSLTRHDEQLHDLIARQNLIVPFLNEAGLRRAIAEPAKRAGRPFEVALVELLVQDTRRQEGVLPILQFTLTQLWDGVARSIPAMRTYEVLGGVGGSLAQETQRLYESLSEPNKTIARRAFLRMVRVSEDPRDPLTARRVDLDDIVAQGETLEEVKAVLDRFARPEARVVTLAAEQDGRITAKVTHEALLERWLQKKDWLTPQAREDLRFHDRLQEEARYWHQRGQSADLLWPCQDLERLRAFVQRNSRDLTPIQHTFWQASDRQEDKNRPTSTARKLHLGYMLTAAIPVILGVLCWPLFIRSQEAQPEQAEEEILAPQFPPTEQTELDIRRWVGIPREAMTGRPTITILGGPPPGEFLDVGPTSILEKPIKLPQQQKSYFGQVMYAAQIVAPKASFAFAPWTAILRKYSSTFLV